MGDMADFYLDNIDPFDTGPDSWDYYDNHEPSFRYCKRCGESGLHWVETPRGWRLYDEFNNLHTCKISAKDFFD